MKKIVLVIAGVAFSFAGWAQKSNIQSARNALKLDKDYRKALEYINMAAEDPSTKDDPTTYFVKGNIYMAMQEDPAHKDSHPYRDAAKAYMKAAELKSKEKQTIDQALLYAAYNYYNDAAVVYNQKKYDEALNYSKEVVKIHDMDGGARFKGNKSFDTVSSLGVQTGAYSAYYAQNYNEALTMLQMLANDPISGNANVYYILAEIYEKQGKQAEQMAALEQGMSKYPGNQALRNAQLNVYIKSGKTDVIIAKLEEAVAKDPTNADYLYILANTIAGIANPKDDKGNELPKPANYTELIDKSEAAYLKALKINAASVDYNYNLGALYYNKATEVNSQMNTMGNTAADQKRYDELKIKRDGFFAQAIPYLEKSYQLLEPKAASLSPDDNFTYQSALVALKEIYARQNQMDKSTEIKKKLDASRAK